MADKLYQDEAWLRNAYLVERKTIQSIADELNVGPTCIQTHLKRFGIPTLESRRKPQNALCNNQAWLKEQYITNRRTIIDIANECNTSDATINNRLRRIGIKTRTSMGTSKDAPYRDKNWLINEYYNKGKSFPMIAREVGLTSGAIQFWMKKLGVPARPYTEASKGVLNPRWCGGKSFEPYCPAFTKSLKESIRDEFGRKCFLCGISENGRKLDIHHVDYNKSQGCSGFKWGLVPLCHRCHTKTNWNRWYWFALLRDYWIYKYSGDFDYMDVWGEPIF